MTNNPGNPLGTARPCTEGRHPARYSAPVQQWMRRQLRGWPGPVLDPFAGTGGVHNLGRDDTWGIEIEPPGTILHPVHPRTLQGDATALPFADASFGLVVTSPTYGNRMADSYAGDGTPRYTYRIAQGQPLRANNSGALHWGPTYRALHAQAWAEVWRVLRPGGLLFVNVSDHIRRHQRRYVTAWHWTTLTAIGFTPTHVEHIVTRRMRHGANRNSRTPTEMILVFTRPDQANTTQLPLALEAVA